jgi:HK97 gp10 family phage protein
MKIQSRLMQIRSLTPVATQKALLQTGADVLAMAKQFVPVDTGSLKDSGGAVPVSSSEVHVGFGGPGVYHQNREPEKYAVHVEYGTSVSPAQPYLRPAFMQAEPTFKARLLQAMKSIT